MAYDETLWAKLCKQDSDHLKKYYEVSSLINYFVLRISELPFMENSDD